MKKLVLILLALIMGIIGVTGWGAPATGAVPIVYEDKESVSNSSLNLSQVETIQVEEVPSSKDSLSESKFFCDEIPLTYEEQYLLRSASDEFGVPYALVLGVIQEKSNFRNVVGCDGASAGYMQIQRIWHSDRMEKLGVVNLLDPNSNFKVGLDYLSELHNIYGDWRVVVTVYDIGYNPGYITNFAINVMNNYANWETIV